MSKADQKLQFSLSPNPSFCSTRFQTKVVDSTILNQTIKIINPSIIDIEEFLLSKEEVFDISYLEDFDDNISTRSILFE